jgi:hypothetical protein
MGMFDLISLLSGNKIDYVLVGGLAVALQGYARNTMDVDVVLAMDAENLERFIASAKAAGLRPTLPVAIESLANPALIDQWHREKGMLAFSLRGPQAHATVIDILVRPAVPYAELRRDAVPIEIGNWRVPVASVDHLIVMKTGTGRSRDAIDVEELEKLRSKGRT